MATNSIPANTLVASTEAGVEERLRRLWALQTRRLVLRGSCRVVAVLAGLILADLCLDWSLDLSGWLRLFLLAANVAVLAHVVQRGLLRPVKRFDPVDLALQVERRWPELDGLVVSGVQFSREDSVAPEISRELMGAVRREAAARTAPLDLAGAMRKAKLLGAVSAAIIAVFAVAALAVWQGRFLRVLGCRMLNPGCGLAYPTRTQIEMLSGDAVVRRLDPVTLAARASGEIPSAGRACIRLKGTSWETASVTNDSRGGFRYVLPRAKEDFDYYFRLGDARSPRHRVTAVRPPCITAAQIELEYPAYTRLAPQKLETLNVKAPEGTRLTWRVEFDRPVETAELQWDGADAQAMAIASNGCLAGLQAPADASRAYSIGFRWRLGELEYKEAGEQHYVQVVPDAEPQARMTQPAEDGKATLKKHIDLSYWAGDDYGLGEAWIVYWVNAGSELRHPLGKLDGRKDVENRFSWPITQFLPGLKTGDIVTFAVEVSDGRPQTPATGRSVSRRVQFVSDTEYLEFIQARQRRLLGQLRPLYLQERQASGQLGLPDTITEASPSADEPKGDRKP